MFGCIIYEYVLCARTSLGALFFYPVSFSKESSGTNIVLLLRKEKKTCVSTNSEIYELIIPTYINVFFFLKKLKRVANKYQGRYLVTIVTVRIVF